MSDVISVRVRWRLLKASHRVYNAADTFPSTDDARSGRFGSQSEHDKTQLGLVIKHLQNYLELNIPGQESLDIGKFSSDVAGWESFATSLGALLGDLEDLVHEDIFDEKRMKLPMDSDRLSSLSGFPKLVALWEALKYRERPQTDDKSSNDHVSDRSNPTRRSSTKSIDSLVYSHQSVIELSQHIDFPRAPELIEKLHTSTSNFQRALKQISEGSAADWDLEAVAGNITAEDIDVIQHADSDNIAALGVLIMELEARRKASWTAEEKDEVSKERPNISRLNRILEDLDWEGDVDDNYREIAKACLEFNSLVNSLDQPRISADRKGLAIIYVKILVPLYDRLVNSFRESANVFADIFNGMLGPGRPLASPVSKPLAAGERVILFDDEDATPSIQEREKSKKFFDEITPIVQYIKDIRPKNPQLARKQHPRIRIAVLDSGVSNDITLISGAIDTEHINGSKSKSFVDAEDSWKQDSRGHGTHMVQLLLQTTPTVEIYVGKICIGKKVEAGCMNRIAVAIDWAVDECDVHIISMSFAYEEDSAMIDAALAKAINRDKLIFAAASNRGGLQGRARPARRNGQEDAMRALIYAGSDMEVRTGHLSMTPLHWAVFKHRVESTRLLLQRGVQVNANDMPFGTALCYPAGEGYLDIVRFLLDHGADTELTSCHEETPLLLAAQRGRVDMLRLLLAWGANIDAKNCEGKTALDLVQVEYRNKGITFDEVVEVLKSH
ncbi:peptidase S8 [Fusarium pseudocircinatum]|uniref:Peptidase S8 n=1 Tax=Fusarium pseudocircinatum TaxID=56676 RepID=A0A8H5NYY7_9HYPO|nr:peptidase S8 [Fusarium pseudocircinatum]